MIIAIDGHSSCGKSTIARALARRLNISYVDSGAMYRAVALFCLKKGIDPMDPVHVVQALPGIHLKILPSLPVRIELNGEDVTDEIRNPEVSRWVSEVAAISEVRREMVRLQREFGHNNSLVMDGRDIGSVVFPEADFKFFVTAEPEIRARRRYRELQEKGIQVDYDEILSNLLHRDHLDSTRSDSPLVQTKEAILIDTSHLGFEEQLQLVLQYIQKS
jgi:cytidylate kinase